MPLSGFSNVFFSVLQYLTPFLVLQTSRRRRESWLFYFCYVLNVMSLGNISPRKRESWLFYFCCVLNVMSLGNISPGKRESWLFYFCCVLNVMSLLSFLTLPRGARGWSVICDCGIP